jgi:3-oxoacyl-[acyl-carrier-protein] synthase-3
MKLYNTKISGSGHYYPPKIMTNNDLAELVDTSDEWIVQRTGIKERRIADPKEDYPSNMSVKAAKMAIADAGIDKNDIDLILVSNTMADHFFPNTSSVVQFKLGIDNNCPCMDLNAACTGWIYGLTVADMFIKLGTYKNILLIGVEMPSNFNNWEDRNSCVLFGDGAGATIISRAEQEEESQVFTSHLTTDGTKWEALGIFNGAAKQPITHEILDNREQFVTMDGQIVFKNAVKTMSKNSAIVLEKAGVTKEEVDWFIPHQANLRIIETTAGLLKYPMDKVITTVQNYANTSSASIPATISEATKAGTIKRGDMILLAAFGSGLTSGALLLKY